MTLNEFIEMLRVDYLDDKAEDGIPLWSDAEIARALSSVIDEFARLLTFFIKDRTTQAVCRIQITTNNATQKYTTLHKSVLFVSHAELSDGTKLWPTTEIELDLKVANWRAEIGTPQFFLFDHSDNSFRLYPLYDYGTLPNPLPDPPTVLETVSLEVWRTLVEKLSAADHGDDELPVQGKWQDRLIPGTLAKLYSKDDVETANMALYTKYSKEHGEAVELTKRDILKVRNQYPRNVSPPIGAI